MRCIWWDGTGNTREHSHSGGVTGYLTSLNQLQMSQSVNRPDIRLG